MQLLKQLIELALLEDVGPGDITTDYIVPRDQAGRGMITAKEPLIIAGLDVAEAVFHSLDESVVCETTFKAWTT